MPFPCLYNEGTHVSTEPTTAPTAAAVVTNVLHLLMNLLMYVSTYCTCTRTYYTYCYPARNMYWHTYELHCWCKYVFIYIYLYIMKRKVTLQNRRYLLHLHAVCTYCTYWCKHCIYLLLMHVRISKKKTTSCCKYLPTAVRTHLLHFPGTRVPTDVRTHLLHILLFLLVHVHTHRTYCFS